MFDIKEYYHNFNQLGLQHDIIEIDEDIHKDIDTLLNSRFERLYARDRYKHGTNIIDIIHPILKYQGSKSIITTPDKIRYLLSFYPFKDDLSNIDKIVLRPRYVEIGNIEMVALYLRKKKILVLYLVHPILFKVGNQKFDNYKELLAPENGTEISPEATMTLDDNGADLFIHPLWYLISNISHKDDDLIDKFFIKNDKGSDAVYSSLNDISFFFSRHGY